RTAAEAPSAAPVSHDDDRGGIRMFGELLFVKPTLDDTTFVVRSPSSAPVPTGQRINDDFDYEPAFRIGAGYELASGRTVEASYARLEANASQVVAGDFLFATRGSPVWGGTFDGYPGFAAADI